MRSRLGRNGLRALAGIVLVFLYAPIVVIFLYAFNESTIQSFPIENWSTKWFDVAWHNDEVRTALWNSVKVGIGATVVALILGTMAAFAVSRFKFFGSGTVSLVLVLPLALPGIVTGIALNNAITFGGDVFGLNFGLITIIIGHATFCVVVVFNNVVARLRRTSPYLWEASQDLGADGWQTFWYVVLPNLSTALVAGALLAFALSFDEIVVTNFTKGTDQTLPLWIYQNFRLPQTRPVVNVVALFVVVLSFIPVYLAQRLTTSGAATGITA